MKVKKFIEENFLIDDASGSFVPFLFNPVQAKYYEILTREYGEDVYDLQIAARELILKARKEGFTSLILAIFAAVMFLSDKALNALEISYKEDATRQHFRRMKNYFLSILTHDPKKWTPQLEKKIFKSSKEGAELVLSSNLSSYYVGTANARTGERGGTVQMILFSEIAHYPNTGIISASEIVESSKSMVAVGTGMIFSETTANGFNHLRRRWLQAKAGEIDDRPRFFGWREFYTPAQFEVIKAGFSDKTLVPQEFPETDREAFLNSGRPVFTQAKLLEMEKRILPPQRIGDLEDDEHQIKFIDAPTTGKLTIWKPPREGRRYIVPADVAEGVPDLLDQKQIKEDHRAWSVAAVIDRASWEVVAELRTKCNPGEFGRKLATLCEYYNWAIAAPERNNPGHATLEALKTVGYPHILRPSDLWPDDKTGKLGFPTDTRTKTLIVTALKDAIDQEQYHENSPVAIDEMLGAVVDESGKMVSSGGFLDCVITRAIGMYCLKFLSVDETYKNPMRAKGGIHVTQAAGIRPRSVNRSDYTR